MRGTTHVGSESYKTDGDVTEVLLEKASFTATRRAFKKQNLESSTTSPLLGGKMLPTPYPIPDTRTPYSIPMLITKVITCSSRCSHAKSTVSIDAYQVHLSIDRSIRFIYRNGREIRGTDANISRTHDKSPDVRDRLCCSLTQVGRGQGNCRVPTCVVSLQSLLGWKIL